MGLGGFLYNKNEVENKIEENTEDANADFSLFDDDLYDNDSRLDNQNVIINKQDEYNGNSKLFEEDLYSNKEDDTDLNDNDIQNEIIDNKKLKESLKQAARQGLSIAVTGSSDSGVSTIACNLAYILNRIGFKILLVDLNTENRTQHILTKENFNSVDMNSDNIRKAVETNINNVYSYISLVKKNLHILCSGISCEPYKINELNNKNQLKKMVNIFKREYDYIIYDIPIEQYIDEELDIVSSFDKSLLIIDGSSSGILKTINVLCNIENEFTLESIFSLNTNIIFNKCRGLKKVLGKNINLYNKKSTLVIDKVVTDLAGCDIGYHFSDMEVIGCIPLDINIENFVCEKEQYINTKQGCDIFINILNNMIM